MATLVELATSVLRRGAFKLTEHKNPVTGLTDTWLVTAQDDVVSTDLRSGTMAMIKPEELVEYINRSRHAVALVEKLKHVEGSISAKELAELMESYGV